MILLKLVTKNIISIHAPREGERLDGFCSKRCSKNDFNPRSPRGGATFIINVIVKHPMLFQSTLPARGSDGSTQEG